MKTTTRLVQSRFVLRGLLSTAAAVAIAWPARAEVAFQPLGMLVGVPSTAEDISADGQTVVGDSDAPFLWTEAGGAVPLPPLNPDAPSRQAVAVSADGSVAAGNSTLDLFPVAVRWTHDGVDALGTLPSGLPASWSEGISDDGSTVVGRSYSDAASGGSGTEAFRWTEGGGLVGLGFLPDHVDSWAYDVSGDGAVVVGYSTQQPVAIPGGAVSPGEAFRWTESAGMESLGLPPAPPGFTYRSSNAYAISGDGEVVFGTSAIRYDDGTPNVSQVFRWTAAEGLVGLGDPFFRPLAANADGTVMVGMTVGPGARAMVWDTTSGGRELAGVLESHEIDLTGWTLQAATGISADGTRIVGRGRNPSGQNEAWLVTLALPGPVCANGEDDDGDGLVDEDDPGCPFPYADTESPPCDDGLDNDGDGLVDFDDPTCAPHWPYWEKAPAAACGLGAELVLVFALAGSLRGWRGAARA